MQLSKTKWDEYARSPEAFRRDLQVDVSGTIKRFGDVQDPWQKADFAGIDAGLMRCAGRTEAKVEFKSVMRAYLERARGHSKTTDLAVTVCWALAFATRPLKGYAFAADQDQAKLLKNAVDVLCRLNPWLGKILEVQKNAVLNVAQGHPGSGASLEISTSDVASSYGILPDLIICDELTHWQGDGSLWHSIISSAAKRESCLLVVIANAGFADSWQWGVREAARLEDGWYFSRLDGPVASWMSAKTLEEQRRMLPGKAFNRLWLNEWSSAGGDALTPEIIAAAFPPEARPMSGMEEGFTFVAGLDLGLTRDNAALVVLAVPSDGSAGKIRLAYNKLWRPTPNQKIDLITVEKHLLEIDRQFGLEAVGFDPWQAEHLAQTIEADSERQQRNARRSNAAEPFMREVPPTATNLRQQATLTIEFFNDRRVIAYDCEDLRRDLNKLRVEEKSYGARLVSPRDGDGHGDTFSAFANALSIAHQAAGESSPFFTYIAGEPESRSAAIDNFANRQAEYQQQMAREQAYINQSRAGNGFADALSQGRVTVITPNRSL